MSARIRRADIDAGLVLLRSRMPGMSWRLRARVRWFIVKDTLIWGPLHRLCLRLSGRTDP